MINWLSEQFNWLKSFFNEKDSDKGSFKRLASFILVIVFVKIFSKVAIKNNVVPDIPETWAFLLGGIILGLGALSVWQNKNK